MDNKGLLELKESLSVLPVLNEKLVKVCKDISEAEQEEKALLQSFEKEALDVEEMKEKSISIFLLKLIGKYEGKLKSEQEEMIEAKILYDKASKRTQELRDKKEELSMRIFELKELEKKYEEEIIKKEEKLFGNTEYQDLESKACDLRRDMVEIKEAIIAAEKARGVAEIIINHLRSAENWATYDVVGGKGFISNICKYDHLDDAQEYFNKLSSKLKDLGKELSDINISEDFEIGEIDETTKMVDLWFDNIFTDLSVRDKIIEDSEKVRELISKLEKLTNNLKSQIKKVEAQLKSIDLQKKALIESV